MSGHYVIVDYKMQNGEWDDILGLVGGDEPHYLSVSSTLIRHQSIYIDDFFLDDIPDPNLKFPNYFYSDYEKNCYPTLWHGYKTTNNKCVPHHNLGLSVLLIPSYLLGGVFGSLTFMILISSLTSIVFFRFIKKITHKDIAIFATLLISFGTIFFSFYDRVYPEPIAALILISSFYLFFSERICVYKYALIGIIIGLLPFFKYSFLIPAAIVVIFFVIFSLKDRNYRRTLLIVLPFLLVLGVFFYHIALIYEDTSQGAGGALSGRTSLLLESIESETLLDKTLKGLASNLFSRNYGLMIFSPLLMLAIFGTKQIWTVNKRIALLTYVLVLTFIVAQSQAFPFAAGFSIPSRYFVFLIPIMGIWLALLLQKYHKNKFFIGILAGLTYIGFVFNTLFLLILNNHTNIGERHERMLAVYGNFGEIFPYYNFSNWEKTSPVFWGNTNELFWVFLISYIIVFIAYLVLPFLIHRNRKTIQ